MATISNTPRPGYVWDSTDNVWYPIGVGGHGHSDYITQATAVNPTIIDAKGDIITATAADTPARLAVGNNGETLVADSSTATGLRYQGSMAAGKNAIINGNFDIWQRGTSFSGAGFFADRWTNLGDLNAVTASRQTSGAPDGSQYYLRLTSTGASSYWSCYQFMETATIAPYWGKTVSFSIKLRRNATLNNSGMNIFLQKSSTVDAGSGATWTGLSSTINASLANMPTGTTSADWYLASGTVTIPNDGSCNSVRMVINYNGATASGSVVDLSQAMIEQGSVPTTFTRAGGTIQGELAACQRYYFRLGGNQVYQVLGGGTANTTTQCDVQTPLPVTMRVIPSSVDYSTVALQQKGGATLNAVTSVTLGLQSPSLANTSFSVASGLTDGAWHRLITNNSTSAYLAYNAEL